MFSNNSFYVKMLLQGCIKLYYHLSWQKSLSDVNNYYHLRNCGKLNNAFGLVKTTFKSKRFFILTVIAFDVQNFKLGLLSLNVNRFIDLLTIL